jgi:hypothetical protein
MSTNPVAPAKADLSGWISAAALFWFEAWGLMGLALIVVMPLVGFMHASWPPSTWTDGSALRLLVVLAIVGVAGIAGWTLTSRHSRRRAAIFAGLGLVGLAATLSAAILGGFAFAAIALWLGWPSVMLVAVWGRRLLLIGSAGTAGDG